MIRKNAATRLSRGSLTKQVSFSLPPRWSWQLQTHPRRRNSGRRITRKVGQLSLAPLPNANLPIFVRVGVGEFGGARIVAAAAGKLQSVAVTEDGALWTWGCGRAVAERHVWAWYESKLPKQGSLLGHGDEEERWVPTVVTGASFGGGRIGRCRGLPLEHALAFAMGTHGRLGASSPVLWPGGGGRAAVDDRRSVSKVGGGSGG